MATLMNFVEQYLLPLSLWSVMFTMGLSLVVDDFRKIAANSRAFLVGTGSMLFLVPLVGTALALLFAPTPALVVGFILLATCPGGLLSNLLTDLAKGDLALSVSMSLFVSIVYIFTLPFIAYFALQAVLGDSQVVQIPLLSSILHIMAITVVPITAGMIVRAWLPRLAHAAGPWIKNASTLALVFVFGLVIWDQLDTLRASFGRVLAMVIAMNVINFGLAVAISRLSRLSPRERISVAIEHLIRQEATAVYVAVSLLGRNDMSLPMIVNTFVGMAFCVVFVWVVKRQQRAAVLLQA